MFIPVSWKLLSHPPSPFMISKKSSLSEEKTGIAEKYINDLPIAFMNLICYFPTLPTSSSRYYGCLKSSWPMHPMLAYIDSSPLKMLNDMAVVLAALFRHTTSFVFAAIFEGKLSYIYYWQMGDPKSYQYVLLVWHASFISDNVDYYPIIQQGL